jgi:ABC-2 type transport system ATP-binding protein
MSFAIEIESLCKTYHQRHADPVVAVDNLNLSIPAGQVMGFLGPNGAGKTTTIKMMCGLVLPDSGTVRLNGYDVLRERSNAMRQIGAVLEGTRNVYWRLTAWANLIYFGRLKGRHGNELKEHAEDLLHALELWDRRDDPVGEFSRGMQQKVAIACALIADPPIVLLDEPTLGLDVQAARTVKMWVRQLSQEQGKTVVLTTHQLDLAQELCDQVSIIHQGRLIADRSLDDLLAVHRQDSYEIRIEGHLSDPIPAWAGDLLVQPEHDHTVLSGGITGQRQLYSLLTTLRDHDITLIGVSRIEPSLEDIFVRLIEDGDAHPARLSGLPND